ncbi:hypothetical protein GSI_14381 [Ganoderma sinense ZZ0214-1]|uniref:Hydrophobin n=1 Tax=Ganoderma sinense ZZ0214-1 TaxID=1077348 RepID=A0A2G8RNJ6_9APHY|nr:hypothetical protein GSI_14381 [Ganoderma sinense ZZ0214-1]
MFSKLALTAVVSAFLAVVTALPTPGAGAGKCNTGSLHCCNTVDKSSDSSVTGGLSLLSVFFKEIDAAIDLQCSPINVIGVGSSSSCNAQPVCCENNAVGGLVSVGCIPVSL